ncbi:MAG: AsmA family protein, partial [Bradyrhizobium sp.]|uniref:AsmA family protein n=1 Tax=Bradyrhizobium sp. TaxID=376 RepID=UPI0025C58AB9
PYFIDWNQFRPQFEAEATRIIGTPVHVGGELDARLLPTPTLRLRSVTVGGANDPGKLHAEKLDVEFSLGSLMRGEWRATELTVNGMAVDLGLDAKGRVDLPAANGTFDPASLSIDRLNLTGRIALHDAASRSTLELNDIAFSGDVRSLAGSVRGDGSFTVYDTRYPFRVSSGQTPDGNGLRVHFSVDPGDRPLSVDLDGLLAFETRVPRFEGAVTLAVPQTKQRAGEAAPTPWKIAAKVKADPAGARLDQVEASYGAEETALKLAGAGDIAFGASPLLRAALSARQLDADRFMGRDNGGPAGLLPMLRTALAAIPQMPIAAQIEFSCEQVTLGGRPLTNIAAELRTDGNTWIFHRLDLRAPGATQIALNGAAARPGATDSLSGRLAIESSDPDTLIAWLQGRSEVGLRNQKPLRLKGTVTIAANHLSIESLQADIDGGAVEGRVAFSQAAVNKGSHIEAELKGDRLDLDAASGFVRSLAGPQNEWPDEARLSLDIGRAISAGQELQPFSAKLAYDQNSFVLDQLKFGSAGGVTLDGGGNFDRVNLQGRLVLNSTAASLGRIASLVTPLAPTVAARLAATDSGSGPASASLVLDIGDNKGVAGSRAALAQFDFETPQLRGQIRASGAPALSALRGMDLDALSRSDMSVQARLSSQRGVALLALLGLDRAAVAGEGPARFEASVTGAWRKPLQLNARISGNGLDADAQGSAEPFADEPKASVDLRVRSANLAPLFGIDAPDKVAQNVSLSSRVTLAGKRLTFHDLDSSVSGSRLRGHLVMMLDQDRSIDGEVGLDTLHLAPALAVAIGAAGHDAAEPLAPGLLKGWRGRIAFQALRGVLPGGAEMRPISGTLKTDGQSMTLDQIEGVVGGGEVKASIDLREGDHGMALNARVQLSGVDSAALQYHELNLPKGRLSLQMALSTQGRSIAALTGTLSGNGTVNLDSAEIVGLDPRAFELAVRASDSGQATDDTRLRQIVEPALSSGSLAVGAAQIPFTIRDGRLRVGATTLDGKNARAIVSGGYDIPADQADIRASLTSTTIGNSNSRPEIQLFAAGPPDRLSRTVDVTSLSSWLAVRAIDRETRRLDAIERGEAPPPATAALPSPAAPGAGLHNQPPSDAPLPGTDPRRFQLKPRAAPTPRPPAAVTPSTPNPPVEAQHAAPLPPPIEVKPPPGPVPVRPKLRPPLVLTPPANP